MNIRWWPTLGRRCCLETRRYATLTVSTIRDNASFKRGHLAARWFLPSFADKSARRVVAGQLLLTHSLSVDRTAFSTIEDGETVNRRPSAASLRFQNQLLAVVPEEANGEWGDFPSTWFSGIFG
jgi:hypothetical protein